MRIRNLLESIVNGKPEAAAMFRISTGKLIIISAALLTTGILLSNGITGSAIAQSNAFQELKAKLAASRPSADQKVFINFITAENRMKNNLKGKTSAYKTAARKRFAARYKNRRIRFRSLCCIGVKQDNYGGNTVVFYVPDPNAGGGCTNRPADERFFFYNVPFVVKQDVSARTAMRYRKGKAYPVSGRLQVRTDTFMFDYDDDTNSIFFMINNFPQEAGSVWSLPSSAPYPPRNESGSIDGLMMYDKMTNQLQYEVEATYYGKCFERYRTIYLK